MADLNALWNTFPNAMQEALDAQAGLDWTHTGVSSGEFSAMQSAVATPEQREAILQVIDEASTSINGQFLELFASDMAELVYGPPPSIAGMRDAWQRCSNHVRDFLSAFNATLATPARLHYLLLDIDGVLKEVHGRLNANPDEGTRQLDVQTLRRLHWATAPAVINVTKRVSIMKMPQMALELEVSRAASALASSSGEKRQGDDSLIAFLKSKRGRRGKLVGIPGESRDDLEAKLHGKWSTEAVALLKDLKMPIVAVAESTADGDRVMALRFRNHRASTIKGRVSLWKRLQKIWLRPHSIVWPNRTQLIDLLDGTGQMSAAKTWPEQVLGAIAFLEEAGGVHMAQRLSEDGIVISHTRALTTELDS